MKGGERSSAAASTSKSAGVTWQAASRLSGIALAFITVKYYILWLGPAYTAYIFALSCASLLSVVDFGISSAGQRFMSTALATNDQVGVKQVLAYTRRLQWLICAVGLFAFGLFTLWFSLYTVRHQGDPDWRLLALCGLQVLITLATKPYLSLATAQDRFKGIALLNTVLTTFVPAAALLFTYFFRTPLILAGFSVVGAYATYVYTRKLAHSGLLADSPDDLSPERKKEILALSWRGYPASLSSTVGNSADKVMVQRAGVAGSLVSYYTSSRISEQIYQIIFPVNTTILPELTRFADTNEPAFNQAVERNMTFSVSLGLSLILVPCALSSSIMTAWLHGTILPGAEAVVWLMGGYRALELLYGTMTMTYYARGIPHVVIPFSTFNAIVTVFGTVPMYLWLGIQGVGLMNLGIDLVQLVPMFLLLRRLGAPSIEYPALIARLLKITGFCLGIFLAIHLCIDRPLARVFPYGAILLAPFFGLLTMWLLTRLQLCPIPERIAKWASRHRIGRLLIATV